MIKDMNECGASLNSSLIHQKKMFADANELANSIGRIYENNVKMTDWTNVSCHLENVDTAEAFKIAWANMHNVVRSSAAMTMSEMSLGTDLFVRMHVNPYCNSIGLTLPMIILYTIEPLRAAVTRMQPEIEGKCKSRNLKLIDYDSYRRRLRDLGATKDKQASKENPTASDLKSLDTTVSELARFTAKLDVAEGLYKVENDVVKDDIIKAKFAHDQLLDMLLVTTIVSQAEIFTRSANELNAIVSTLPIHKVDQVRKRIEQVGVVVFTTVLYACFSSLFVLYYIHSLYAVHYSM